MKHRALVTDVADPKQLGRIRVRLLDSLPGADETPWALPCSPFAGFVFLPSIGDNVWVEQAGDGSWVYVGHLWTVTSGLPDGADLERRILRTPAGHAMMFDDNGDIEIRHQSGAAIILKPDGEIHIGSGATEAAVFGNRLLDRFNDLVSAFNTHTHSVQSAPGSTAASLTKAYPLTDNELSSKVKIG